MVVGDTEWGLRQDVWDELPPLSADDLTWWLEGTRHLWKYRVARTAATPHGYFVVGPTKGFSRADALRGSRTLSVWGQPEKFNSHVACYLRDPDPTTHPNTPAPMIKWWMMDDDPAWTVLINQTSVELTNRNLALTSGSSDPREYVPTEWDQRGCRWDQHERAVHLPDGEDIEALKATVRRRDSAPTVLDVGAGTGRVLDLGLTSAHKVTYRAVEPSKAMLNRLVKKHDRVGDVHPCTIETYLDRVDAMAEGGSGTKVFDIVYAIGGTADLLSQQTIDRLRQLAVEQLVLGYRDGSVRTYAGEAPKP